MSLMFKFILTMLFFFVYCIFVYTVIQFLYSSICCEVINMDTIQLEYLIKISELHALSRVADFYKVPYQNISRQIERLEKELGTKLIVKSNKGCDITAQGNRVLEFANKFFLNYNFLKNQINSQNSIRIGVDRNFVHPKLVDFIYQYNDPNISLVPTDFAHIVQNFDKDLIDCFVGYEKDLYAKINFMPIAKDHVMVMMSPRHPLSKKSKIEFSDFKSQIVYFGRFLWKRRDKVIDSINFQSSFPNIILNYDYFQLITDFYKCSAVIILPKNYLNTFVGDSVAIPLENESIDWGLYYKNLTAPLLRLLNDYNNT